MLLTKEIYREENFLQTKKIFYNDKQQIIGTLEISKANGDEHGQLSVHEYIGENYRLVKYNGKTKTYANFASRGHAVLGQTGWHSIEEAFSVQDFKYANGVLIAENYRDEDGTTYSHTYTYQNGVKVSETTVGVDGTVTKVNYTCQGKKLLSKATFVNDQFSDQINYLYHQNDLLSVEQKFLRHKESLYLSSEKKFFYNAKKELEKTEYYGRYDANLHLYKVDETVRKGNERTIKQFFVPEVEMVIGHYDLAAMHDYLKRENWEWAVSIFGKQYMTTVKLQTGSHTVERLDEQGNIVESKAMHPDPDNNEELAKVLYRNEYNEQSLLEFVISYRVNEEGKAEESSIRKFYYKD